jgi:DNA-binding FadR family transcriptional regulator
VTDDLGLYQDINLTRERLHVQIADRIQGLIAEQKLQPGDRLPPDRLLASMLEVSRPTVREALRLLQHRGLVYAKPGSGTYVTEMGSGPIIQSIERFFSARECTFEDLMQVRDLLEPGTAALAAISASPEDIEGLRQRVLVLEEAFHSGDPSRLASADSGFHVELAKASGNQLLAALTASFAHLNEKWTEQVSSSVLAEDVNKSHRAIVEAIADGDAERARQMCEAHMEMAREVLVEPSTGQAGTLPYPAAELDE